jgi:hypothetical protein
MSDASWQLKQKEGEKRSFFVYLEKSFGVITLPLGKLEKNRVTDDVEYLPGDPKIHRIHSNYGKLNL